MTSKEYEMLKEELEATKKETIRRKFLNPSLHSARIGSLIPAHTIYS